MTYRVYRNLEYVADLYIDHTGEMWSMESSVSIPTELQFFIIESLLNDPNKKADVLNDDLYVYEPI